MECSSKNIGDKTTGKKEYIVVIINDNIFNIIDSFTNLSILKLSQFLLFLIYTTFIKFKSLVPGQPPSLLFNNTTVLTANLKKEIYNRLKHW